MAMRIYRASGDIEVVRAALGHASVATTVRYARCDEGGDEEGGGSVRIDEALRAGRGD